MLAKNEKGVLPLDAKSVRKILVVGKNAAERQCHKGCSAEGTVPYEVTFVDGLKARLGKDAEIVLKPIPRAAAKKATKEELEAVARAGGHVEAGAKADGAS